MFAQMTEMMIAENTYSQLIGWVVDVDFNTFLTPQNLLPYLENGCSNLTFLKSQRISIHE